MHINLRRDCPRISASAKQWYSSVRWVDVFVFHSQKWRQYMSVASKMSPCLHSASRRSRRKLPEQHTVHVETNEVEWWVVMLGCPCSRDLQVTRSSLQGLQISRLTLWLVPLYLWHLHSRFVIHNLQNSNPGRVWETNSCAYIHLDNNLLQFFKIFVKLIFEIE